MARDDEDPLRLRRARAAHGGNHVGNADPVDDAPRATRYPRTALVVRPGRINLAYIKWIRDSGLKSFLISRKRQNLK